MSFDVAIWRRSPRAKTAMIVEVNDALGERDHPAAAAFDTEELVAAACLAYERLPSSNEELTWIAVPEADGGSVGVSLHQWSGGASACVRASGPFDALAATVAALLPLVVERDLVLYDVQAQVVHNNRRSYPGAAADAAAAPR